GRHAFQRAEVFADGGDFLPLIQAALFGQISETVAIGRREGPAENLDAPAVGLDQIENRANERRLPGAVRSEESEDLAAIDIERHVVERLRLPEALRDAVDVNDRSHGPKATSSVRRTENRLCSCLTSWIN